jgi:hypothetical protein
MRLGIIKQYLIRIIEKICLLVAPLETDAAIDSTKQATPGYHNKLAGKGKKQKRRERNHVRIHTVVGINTYIVMAADVGTRFEDEKNFFGSLLRQATRVFKLKTISGDKNYSSMATVRIAEELECVPYLYPKKSFKIRPGEKYRAWNGNIKRCRGGTERDKEIVRLRKRIETAYSMLKQRFGRELRSKTLRAQTNEALCLVICHNLRVLLGCSGQSGLEVNFPPDEGSPAAQEQTPSNEGQQD